MTGVVAKGGYGEYIKNPCKSEVVGNGRVCDHKKPKIDGYYYLEITGGSGLEVVIFDRDNCYTYPEEDVLEFLRIMIRKHTDEFLKMMEECK